MRRYLLMPGLLVLTMTVHARSATPVVTEPDVPEAVHAAVEQARYWQASRVLDRHLATLPDTTPELMLYAAQVNAGWGRWDRVAGLLQGRNWLDRVDSGAGWELLGRAQIGVGRPAAGARALARYIELGGGDRDRGVAELRRGLALREAEDWTGAMAAFDRAREMLPWFSDWSSLYAAEAAAEAGDTAAVRTWMTAAGGLAEGREWRLRLDAALAAGDSLRGREIALATAESEGGATGAAAWARLGELRLAAGDTARARAAFWQAMQTPAAAGAVTAARTLAELSPSPVESRRIADIYARHGNAARAARGYRAYLDGGSGSPEERQQVRLQLGQALFNAGTYAEAERRLLELAVTSSVAPAMGAEALYLAGRAQYRQGRSQEGQRTLARLPQEFPGQEAVTRGLYLLADLKHDDQEIAAARRYYRQAADAAPHLNEAGLALMRLGGLDLLAGDYEAAAEIFEEYRRLHPDGRRWSQSTYWAARAYDGLGQPSRSEALLRELRVEDPLSLYGIRAASLLGVPVLPELSSGPPADAVAGGEYTDGLQRLDVLHELGRGGDLGREADRLRARLEGDPAAEYALAEALIERDRAPAGITMGWTLYRRNGQWDGRLLRIVYPFPYRTLVLPEAAARGLDPYLVAGLIRQESAFSPTVSSGAGAIGLMQVMPETGRMLASEAGLSGYDPALLRQPDVNVHLGTRYLATMLDRFEGDLPLVLSAYNAGPTRAARWRNLPEARDPELFTERVPYPETRDYIRHVTTNRALYRALYPGHDPGGAPDRN